MFATGAARDRLVTAVLAEARSKPPEIPPLPEGFAHLRRELGAQLYGSMGIAREDTEGRRVAGLRNWEFFRAPLAGIVCIHSDLGPADCLCVGMYLQTLLLALTVRGVGTCVQVSIAGYPDIVREQLDIPANSAFCAVWRSATPTRTFPRTNSASPATPSTSTWCS